MESVLSFFSYELGGITLYGYLGAFGFILAGFIARKMASLLIGRLAAAAGKTAIPYDEMVLQSLEAPLGWGCVLLGFYLAISILPIPTEPVNVERFVNASLRVLSIVLILWFCARLLDRLADYWTEISKKTDSRLDDQIIPIFRSAGKTFIYLVGAVFVLQNMGYSVSSLLAGVGIGGAAVALASKDMLANLFGSVVVFLDKPFTIGDWIEMGETEGTVEEVGLRTTKVRTFANSLVTLPNHTFTTTSINNWSRMKKRRIKMTVGLTYDTPPEKMDLAVEAIREILIADPKIHQEFFLVNFDAFGPYSLDIFVYCFTVTTNWKEFLDAKQEFLLKIMSAVHGLGLSFAFPTQSIQVDKLPGEPEAMLTERPI